jgi:hypothetical protein
MCSSAVEATSLEWAILILQSTIRLISKELSEEESQLLRELLDTLNHCLLLSKLKPRSWERK